MDSLSLPPQEMWFYQLSLASNKGHEESLELTITEQLLATIAKEGGASGEEICNRA